jgi:hypothetical protein
MAAPTNCAAMNAATPAGAIPEKLSVAILSRSGGQPPDENDLIVKSKTTKLAFKRKAGVLAFGLI